MPYNLLKAQMKMGESIAIMVIFFFIVVFGFIFYSNVEKGSIEDDRSEINSLRAISITQFISFLPEVQCSFNNVPTNDCFDILRMTYFQNLTNSSADAQLYYYDLLSYTNITVKEVFPNSGKSWVLYNRNSGSTSKKSTPIPITLYNPISNSYSMGILTVEVFS
jgi:hypothetical protein